MNPNTESDPSALYFAYGVAMHTVQLWEFQLAMLRLRLQYSRSNRQPKSLQRVLAPLEKSSKHAILRASASDNLSAIGKVLDDPGLLGELASLNKERDFLAHRFLRVHKTADGFSLTVLPPLMDLTTRFKESADRVEATEPQKSSAEPTPAPLRRELERVAREVLETDRR
jgi:hypothetical protein